MRYAAFLRAINVGKHNRIRMADLRTAMEAAGLADAKTYLQSGNVWFDSEEPDPEAVAGRLEAVLASMGCRGADVMVRSLGRMQALIDLEPFADTPPGHYKMAVFLRHPLAEITTGHPVIELLRSTGQEVFLRADPSMRDQKVGVVLKTKTPHTVRFWNVVQEMHSRMRG